MKRVGESDWWNVADVYVDGDIGSAVEKQSFLFLFIRGEGIMFVK